MSNQCEQPQKSPAEAWKARWPNHCKACGGWGVFRYANAETGEATLTSCDALPAGTLPPLRGSAGPRPGR